MRNIVSRPWLACMLLASQVHARRHGGGGGSDVEVDWKPILQYLAIGFVVALVGGILWRALIKRIRPEFKATQEAARRRSAEYAQASANRQRKRS